jgi:predicted phage terminase large subunit-like protein
VCGLGTDGVGYVLEDLTIKAGPSTWGGVAVSAYERHMADLIVGEKNFGGEMVRFVVEAAAEKAAKRVPFKFVQASRGKVVRAEPISALHEKGKIRFMGRFNQLEDELCAFTHNGYAGERSPNRADAFVWAMTELFHGMTKREEAPRSRPRMQMRQQANGFLAA